MQDQMKVFNETVCLFSHDYLKCCLFLTQSKSVFSKRLYASLIYQSVVLEDFLDFHGAKNNKEWLFYRELSAAVRHLSMASYSQKHILNRLAGYSLDNTDKFKEQSQKQIQFLISVLKGLAPIILKEAYKLKIPIPNEHYTQEDFPSTITGAKLINNIDDEQEHIVSRQEHNLVKLSTEFLNITKFFEDLIFYEPYDEHKILALVNDQVITEVEIRRYEMLIHNLQSYFDTYVIHGSDDQSEDAMHLQQFRSNFSVVFHLLEVMGRLLHFYERHLKISGGKTTYCEVQKQLEQLVNSSSLLDQVINYGLFYVCHFMISAKPLVQQIINANIERTSISVNVPSKRGFHTRPSLLIAKIVRHYGAKVELCLDQDCFDAGSVLDLQWAGGKIQHEGLSNVVFKGDARALRDIEKLAALDYCEDAFNRGNSFPEDLEYLRT